MEVLRKFVDRLTSEVVDCLIREDSIKNDLNTYLDVKICTEDISCIRSTVLNRFKQMMEESISEFYEEDNVSHTLFFNLIFF